MKEMEELRIEVAECKSCKLLSDLNMEKGFGIEEIKEKDMKLKRPNSVCYHALLSFYFW